MVRDVPRFPEAEEDVEAGGDQEVLAPADDPRGQVVRAMTRAVTTVPKAAPITTATARSITLPRRTNSRNPFSLGTTSLWKARALY